MPHVISACVLAILLTAPPSAPPSPFAIGPAARAADDTLTVSRLPRLDPRVAAWEFPITVDGQRWRVRVRPASPPVSPPISPPITPGTTPAITPGAGTEPQSIGLVGSASSIGSKVDVIAPVFGAIDVIDGTASPAILVAMSQRLILALDDRAFVLAIPDPAAETPTPDDAEREVERTLRVRVIDDDDVAAGRRGSSALATTIADHVARQAGIASFMPVGDPDAAPTNPRPHATLHLRRAAATAEHRSHVQLTINGDLCDPHGRHAELLLPAEVDPLVAILTTAAALLEIAGAPVVVGGEFHPDRPGAHLTGLRSDFMHLDDHAAAAFRDTLDGLDCLAPRTLGAPTALAATRVDCGVVELSWTAAEWAHRHEVLIGDADHVPDQTTPTTLPDLIERMRSVAIVDGTTWRLDNAPHHAHSYIVRGITDDRRGPPSRAASVDGLDPLGNASVEASIGACNGIDLRWTPVDGAVRYEVLRAPQEGATPRRIAESVEPHHRDEAVRPGDERWYSVVAVDACGRRGPPSPTARGSAGVPPRTVPSLDAVVDCDGVRLRWAPVPEVTHYIVLRGVGDAAPEPVGFAEATTWFDTEAPADAMMRYVVRAAGPCGLGSPSPASVVHFLGRTPLLEPVAARTIHCGEAAVFPPPSVRNADCAGAIVWLLPEEPRRATLSDAGDLLLTFSEPGTHLVPLRAVAADDLDGGVAMTVARVEVTPTAPSVAASPLERIPCGVPWRAAWPALANAQCAGAVQWRIVDAPDGVVIDQPVIIPESARSAPPVGVRWAAPRPGDHVIRLECAGAGGAVATTLRLRVDHDAPLMAASIEHVVPAGVGVTIALPPPDNALCCGAIVWSIRGEVEGPGIAALEGDPSTSLLVWERPPPGRHRVVCVATGPGGIAEVAVDLRIAPPAPAIAPVDAVSAECGAPWQSAPAVVLNLDDAGPVLWSLGAAPPGVVLIDDGVVHWPQTIAGTHAIELAATGPGGRGSTTIVVSVPHAVPIVTAPERLVLPAEVGSLDVDLTATFMIANAPCAGPVTWRVVAAPEGVALAAQPAEDIAPDGDESGNDVPDVEAPLPRPRLVWPTPTVGTHPITLAVANDRGETSVSLPLEVAPAAPQIESLADASAECGHAWESPLPRVVNPQRAGAVEWSLVSAPEGLTLHDGALRWPRTTAGAHSIELIATGAGGIGATSMTIMIDTLPPQLSPPAAQTIPCGVVYPPTRIELAVPHCSPSELTWRVIEGPTGFTVDDTGTAHWPDPVPGHYPTTVEVSSAKGTDHAAWTITVEATAAPEIEPVPDFDRVELDDELAPLPYHGPALRLTRPTCMEPVTWQLATAPLDMTIDADGTVHWDAPELGEHEIVVEASNPSGTTTVRWSLQVVAVKEAPISAPVSASVFLRDVGPYTAADAAWDAEPIERRRNRDAGPHARGDGHGAPVRGLPPLPEVAQPQVHAGTRRHPRRDHRARRPLRS